MIHVVVLVYISYSFVFLLLYYIPLYDYNLIYQFPLYLIFVLFPTFIFMNKATMNIYAQVFM